MRNEEHFDIGKFLDKSRAIRDMFERRLLLPIDRFVIQHKKGDKAEFLFEIDFYEENYVNFQRFFTLDAQGWVNDLKKSGHHRAFFRFLKVHP